MRLHTVRLTVTLALGILIAALAAEAQPPTKVHRIGRLRTGSPLADQPFVEALSQGLRDLGYVEGRNILIESRYAEGQPDRLPALAAELVRLPVDVLVAGGSAAIQAAQHATSTIPIVMAVAPDPVAQEFIASLARPGGNLTGLSIMYHDFIGKQLELLMDTVPTASRVAVLTNPANAAHVLQLREVQRAAQVLGRQLHVLEARSPDDLQRVFTAIPRESAHALFVITDALLFDRFRADITAWALQSRLPAIYGWRMYVEAGGLMSYGPSLPDMHYRAAYYVDRLLKGTPPADLPVEQPRKFELVINLKTAEALGLTLPPHLLTFADEVIR
jgi:ABC-type uncharacterized transport system substrate-binding protein